MGDLKQRIKALEEVELPRRIVAVYETEGETLAAAYARLGTEPRPGDRIIVVCYENAEASETVKERL